MIELYLHVFLVFDFKLGNLFSFQGIKEIQEVKPMRSALEDECDHWRSLRSLSLFLRVVLKSHFSLFWTLLLNTLDERSSYKIFVLPLNLIFCSPFIVLFLVSILCG